MIEMHPFDACHHFVNKVIVFCGARAEMLHIQINVSLKKKIQKWISWWKLYKFDINRLQIVLVIVLCIDTFQFFSYYFTHLVLSYKHTCTYIYIYMKCKCNGVKITPFFFGTRKPYSFLSWINKSNAILVPNNGRALCLLHI